MRNDKEQALKLRLQGKSYNQITVRLGIPKSTLAGWFSGLELSTTAKQRIQQRVHEGSVAGLIKKNKLQTHLAQQRARSIRQISSQEIANLSPRELLITGVALYWGEGYKRPIIKNGIPRTYHPVKLTNSDPNIIKIFLKFLRETCGIPEEKIYAGVRIYQHHNENELLDFWHRTTKIPKNQFRKFYYGISKSSLGKRPFNILPYGTMQIEVGDTKLYHRIMGWIEGLQNIK